MLNAPFIRKMSHIFLALKTSMSISSDSEKIFDIIYRIGGEKVDFYPLSSSENIPSTNV
jgi:hypothetical protein